MKTFAAAIAAVLMVVSVACGTGTPPPEAPRKFRFAVIPKALDIPVFDYAKKGAERAARELGNVEVIWRGPETGDQLKQKEILEAFITQRVDGIAISCLNGDFLTDTINRAVDSGIPVITWDADAPNSKRLAFYGVDDLESGRVMGQEAARLLNGKGTVAILTSIGATNLQRRLDGVMEVLKKHPGIRVIETYDVKEDMVRAAELLATGTNRYPNLGAWISVGGWPVFTRNALAPVPKTTHVISFDTIQPAPELLREGKVAVLIGQKYFGWGEEPVKLLAGIKAGKMPPSTIIDSGVDVVRADNLDKYLLDWKRMESGQ
jgi:ribose transport system substrate-binding protein